MEASSHHPLLLQHHQKFGSPSPQEEMLFQALSLTLWAANRDFWGWESLCHSPSPINFQAHVALAVLQPTQTSGKAKPKHAPGGQSLQTPRVNTLRCGLQHPLAKTQSKGHWWCFMAQIKASPIFLSRRREGYYPRFGKGQSLARRQSLSTVSQSLLFSLS